MEFQVLYATKEHTQFAQTICDEMESSAKARGTGIAKRDPQYLVKKMEDGKSVIAFLDGAVVGFCYIEAWGHGKYVVNSGLIVFPEFRKSGLATEIKRKIFQLSRQLYPTSKIFGITTSLAVMKINTELGYKPVTFSELTDDETFWTGCKSCVNFDVLTRNNRKICLCTGMLFDPKLEEDAEKKKNDIQNVRNFNFAS